MQRDTSKVIATYKDNAAYQIDTIHVQSTILKEDREVILYKPDKITQSDSMIFIYLLDGEYSL